MQDTRLLTTQQAADYLSVESRSIRRWLKAGKLQGYKLPGGDWRICLEDLLALLNPPVKTDENTDSDS